MAKRTRVVELGLVDGWSLSRAAAKSGWSVVQGSVPRRHGLDEAVPGSRLRLVENEAGSSEYEPVLATAAITPKWIQAIWLGSVLVSGLALYLVSNLG